MGNNLTAGSAPTGGRPAFIPRERFRTWLSRTELDGLLRVDGILPSSYIQRSARAGRPIPARGDRWRPLDLVARAKANAHRIEPPLVEKLRRDIDELRHEYQELLRAVAVQTHIKGVALVSTALTGKTILTESEIAAGGHEIEPTTGIYFLIRNGRVKYVGQSTFVPGRVRQHLSLREVTHYAWIPCAPSELDMLESIYIHALRPEWNGTGSDGTPNSAAPLPLDRLLRLAGAKAARKS